MTSACPDVFAENGMIAFTCCEEASRGIAGEPSTVTVTPPSVVAMVVPGSTVKLTYRSGPNCAPKMEMIELGEKWSVANAAPSRIPEMLGTGDELMTRTTGL